jgi:hypothetical protein
MRRDRDQIYLEPDGIEGVQSFYLQETKCTQSAFDLYKMFTRGIFVPLRSLSHSYRLTELFGSTQIFVKTFQTQFPCRLSSSIPETLKLHRKMVKFTNSCI